jgi:hypothetical protein
VGDRQSELAQYQQALIDDPEHIDAMNCIGSTFMDMREYGLAIQWFSKTLIEIERQEARYKELGSNPRNRTKLFVIVNLSSTCQRMGDLSTAAKWLQKGVALFPNEPELRNMLTCVETALRFPGDDGWEEDLDEDSLDDEDQDR